MGFGLKQSGGKLRLIDDFSLPQINSAFSPSERITLEDIDSYAAQTKALMLEAQQAHVALSLVGRTLDLRAAYSQLAVSPQSRWSAIVAVWDPTIGRVAFFHQLALPFGQKCFSLNAQPRGKGFVAGWYLCL